MTFESKVCRVKQQAAH